MLTRLIYASEATEPLTSDSVQAIVDTARERNVERNLTGMMVFDRRAFLQTLEGRREAVSEMFCRIATDRRHRRVLLLEVLPVDERLFPDWAMGFAATDALGREQLPRYGVNESFDPHALTAGAALGLLRRLAQHAA